MATRFYLPSTGAAAVSPAYDGAWATAPTDRRAMVTTRINSSMTNASYNTRGDEAAGEKCGIRQYVSAPIPAQTITGTVKGQIRANEENPSDNYDRVILGIRVVSNDGSTVRGTLLSVSNYGPTTEFTSSVTTENRKIADGDALSSVAALDNDRIVIELGVSPSAGSTAFEAGENLTFGDDSGSDLPEDESTSTANNPWIEFSQDLFLQTLTPSAVAGTGVAVLAGLILGVSEVSGVGAYPTPTVEIGPAIVTPAAVEGIGEVGTPGWDHLVFPAVEGVGTVEQTDLEVISSPYNPADDTVLMTDVTGTPGNKIYPTNPSTLYDQLTVTGEGVGTFSGPGSGDTTIYGTSITGVNGGSGTISYCIMHADVTTDDTVIGTYVPHTIPQFYLKESGPTLTYGIVEGIVPANAGESSHWVSDHITGLTWADLEDLQRMGITAHYLLDTGESSSLFLQEIWMEVYGPQGTFVPPIVVRARTGDIIFRAELEV